MRDAVSGIHNCVCISFKTPLDLTGIFIRSRILQDFLVTEVRNVWANSSKYEGNLVVILVRTFSVVSETFPSHFQVDWRIAIKIGTQSVHGVTRPYQRWVPGGSSDSWYSGTFPNATPVVADGLVETLLWGSNVPGSSHQNKQIVSKCCHIDSTLALGENYVSRVPVGASGGEFLKTVCYSRRIHSRRIQTIGAREWVRSNVMRSPAGYSSCPVGLWGYIT